MKHMSAFQATHMFGWPKILEEQAPRHRNEGRRLKGTAIVLGNRLDEAAELNRTQTITVCNRRCGLVVLAPRQAHQIG